MRASSEDLLTLPNAVSTIGFALTIRGSGSLDSTDGIFQTVSGRLLDVVDGKLARATGQTSEIGAALDATLDKLGGLAIVAGEWKRDIAPKPALTAILVQNTANALATTWAAKRHPEEQLAPSRDGKYAMAIQNLALGAYAIGANLHESQPQTSGVFRKLGHLATAVGVGYFGIKATAHYIKRARD